MAKAEEKAIEEYPDTQPYDSYTIGKRIGYRKGYYQAEQDLMEKAKQWFTEHTNIPYNVETNEDGEPLADSYIQYAKARLDAANEIFEKFKQFITD